ncbi:MAG TPA: DNA gyrase C-terminal beta-propeller domain-containing protein, partial [Bacteroidia bacterium]|nr:DNA gyrase C-terminal beta-propeller domain-containing protein [Bacteroidia bacterium]
LEDYRVTNRGGKGVKTMNITEKTGDLIAIKSVKEDDDLMIINKSGITIRMEVKDLRVMGRNTQGVKLIRLDDDDSIASVAKIDMEITGNGNHKENGNDTEENPVTDTDKQNNNQTEENNSQPE